MVYAIHSKCIDRKVMRVQVSPPAQMKYLFIILVIVVSILEVAGDIFFKEWTIHKKNIYLIIGAIVYMGATIFWALSLNYQSLSKAVVIFGVLTVIVGVFVGTIIYKEPLSTINIVGIILGLTSIYLLEI